LPDIAERLRAFEREVKKEEGFPMGCSGHVPASESLNHLNDLGGIVFLG
jgi:hypothetical protein